MPEMNIPIILEATVYNLHELYPLFVPICPLSSTVSCILWSWKLICLYYHLPCMSMCKYSLCSLSLLNCLSNSYYIKYTPCYNVGTLYRIIVTELLSSLMPKPEYDILVYGKWFASSINIKLLWFSCCT